jgi:hypothetical protein
MFATYQSSEKELTGEKLIGEKLGRRGGRHGEAWLGSHQGEALM